MIRPRRWRAALAGAAVLAGVLPAVASAYAPPLTCRDVATTLGWQRIPVERFQPIEGVTSTDRVTGYSLSAIAPQNVVVTNGKRLKVSGTNGCAWDDGLTLGLQPSANVPFPGTTSTIVSTATLPNGRVLAAVREGTGAASRPHVVGSDNGRTGYQTHDSGLPPQGAPRFLEASDDGRTIYLVLAPSSSSSDPDSPLPGLPDVTSPATGAKAGLLYASTDGGRSWALRTSIGDLPAGGGGLDRLAVDRQNANRLYAISNGLLLFSSDGGANFARVRINNEDITAVETGPGGFVIAFSASGLAAVSTDGRNVFRGVRAPARVTSAAYRGENVLAVEAGGVLSLLDFATGRTTRVPGVPAAPGSLVGSVGKQPTFHGVSGRALLRYSDPPPVDTPVDPTKAIGDIGVSKPPPGTITPAARTVQLKVGESTVVDYSLALPRSPTPLDLFFLVDTSDSMRSLIADLKANIGRATATIQRAGIDLQVGLATVGVGPEAGQGAPPTFTSATGSGPKLYELIRPIGPVTGFGAALAKVTTKTGGTNGSEEAQNIGLEQATAGLGVRDPSAPDGVDLFIVPPGQAAGWREGAADTRRLIVHATDEGFSRPAGTRLKDGEPDTDYTIRLMKEYRVQQVGLSLQVPDAQADLEQVARGTKTFAPPGGSDCGQDVILPAGAPLVCDTTSDFSAVLGPLVRSLVDRQRVTLTARGPAPQVIRAIDAPRLSSVDVTVANRLPFKVAVTCKGQSVGRYTENVVATLRGSRVASTRLTVDCIGPAAAAARQIPPPIPPGAPAPAPVAQAPAAVVPAPPAAQPQLQPQSQPQVQSQVNPMTAAAMQRQEELQLALALQADEKQGQTGTEMAMVSARRRDESAALVLLAAAMAASAGLGLARLRSRPAPSVVRARNDR